MNKCVLLVCDQGYIDFAARLVKQIRDTNPSDFDILIGSPDPLSQSAAQAGAKHLPIEVDGFIKDLPASERLKHYTYWRFPAIEKAAQDYERILYLDIDIYCAAPGISALLDVPLQEKCLAAITDVCLYYRPKRLIPEYVSVELEHAGYFNAGVLLISGPLWRKQGRLEQIQQVCSRFPDALIRYDQSALNLVFYKDWLELSPVWNWQYSKRNAYIAVHAGPRLVHYAGVSKIWNSRSDKIVRSHWLSFNFDQVPEQTERKGSISLVYWQYIWASLWNLKPFLKYIGRFSDDFTGITHK